MSEAIDQSARNELLQTYSQGKLSAVSAVNQLGLYDYAELVRVMEAMALPLPPPPEPINFRDFITLGEAFALSNGE